MRDRMVIAESSSQSNDLEPRTRRAIIEEMAISLLEKGGRYKVQSGSGTRYEVDVIGESCSCPDWQQRLPEAASTCVASITRANGVACPDQTAAFQQPRCKSPLSSSESLLCH